MTPMDPNAATAPMAPMDGFEQGDPMNDPEIEDLPPLPPAGHAHHAAPGGRMAAAPGQYPGQYPDQYPGQYPDQYPAQYADAQAAAANGYPPAQPNADHIPISPVDRRAQVAMYVFVIVEVLLALRFFLKVFGASPDAAFSALLYGITEPLVILFQGVFPEPQGRGPMFEVSTVLAIVVYALIAWAVVRWVRISGRRRGPAAPY